MLPSSLLLAAVKVTGRHRSPNSVCSVSLLSAPLPVSSPQYTAGSPSPSASRMMPRCSFNMQTRISTRHRSDLRPALLPAGLPGGLPGAGAYLIH